jgi:prepilin-type N-terminal cleavage/methylation domain-containing protein
MKSLWQPRKNRAFTLVELLVVIAIIAIIAALLLPALVGGKKRAQRIECINNLNQIGTAFQMFAHDHQGNFPMQVPEADGGSQEYARGAESSGGHGFFYSWRHFFALENDLTTPKPLVCPADLERVPAESFRTLRNSNLSYAIGITANYNDPGSILAADRNITNLLDSDIVTMMAYRNLSWTRDLHHFKGNVLFSDSHVEQWNSVQIPAPTNTVLFLPTIPPSSTTTDSGPPSAPNPGGSPTAGPGGPPTGGTGGPSAGGPGAPPAASPGTPASQSPPPGGSSSGTPSTSSSTGHRRTGASAPPAGSAPSQMSAPLGNTMSSSGAPKNGGSSGATDFVDNNAREKKRGTATNVVANPLAAPPVEDYQAPLARLFGAASPDGPKSHWWLWLLLVLLLIAAAYVYSRWKKYYEREEEHDDD